MRSFSRQYNDVETGFLGRMIAKDFSDNAFDPVPLHSQFDVFFGYDQPEAVVFQVVLGGEQ